MKKKKTKGVRGEDLHKNLMILRKKHKLGIRETYMTMFEYLVHSIHHQEGVAEAMLVFLLALERAKADGES